MVDCLFQTKKGCSVEAAVAAGETKVGTFMAPKFSRYQALGTRGTCGGMGSILGLDSHG